MNEQRGPHPEQGTDLASVDLWEHLKALGLGFHVLLGSALFVGLVLALELLPPGWATLLGVTYLAAWLTVFVVRYRRRDRMEASRPVASIGRGTHE